MHLILEPRATESSMSSSDDLDAVNREGGLRKKIQQDSMVEMRSIGAG